MKKKGLAVIASVVLGVCTAQALVLFESDFEGYDLGASLKGTNAWNAINETNLQGAVVFAINSPLGAAGSQAMHFRDTFNGPLGNSLIYRQVNGIVSNNIAVFNFDFMADTSEQSPQILLQFAGTTVVQLTVHPNGVGTGPIKYHNGGGFQTIPSTLATNTWYRFALTANVDTDTFDLVVTDGINTHFNQTGLSFKNSVSNINRIAFSSNASVGGVGASYYFDNVTAGNDVIAVIPPPLPSTFISATATAGDLVKIEISAPEPDRAFLFGRSNLGAGSWTNVPHSDDGSNAFTVTNLTYSTSETNGNISIYVNATNAAGFFSTGHSE